MMFLTSVALFTVVGLALHSSRPVRPVCSVRAGRRVLRGKQHLGAEAGEPGRIGGRARNRRDLPNVAPSKLKTRRSVVAPAGRAEKTRMPRALMRALRSLKTAACPGTSEGAAPRPTAQHALGRGRIEPAEVERVADRSQC